MEQGKSEQPMGKPPQLERVPLRRWELVLFGLGVLVAASWILVPTLGEVSYRISLLVAEDCGPFDFTCLGWLIPGVVLGVVAATAVTYAVVRRWRRQAPHRAVAWLVGLVLPVVVVVAAKMIWG
jgi:hypothetical protein